MSVVVSVLSVGEVDDARLDAFWTVLSKMERAEAERVADRRGVICARALVRFALSYARPEIAADAWTFERDEAGKPHVSGVTDAPAFNLSHTTGLAVCAVGAGPLGVDAEPLANGPDILETVLGNFAPPEVIALRGLSPEQQLRRAVELWTVKEAYLKGLGTGISRRLDRFIVTPAEAGWTVSEDPRWRVTTREHRLCLISVATLGRPPIVFRDPLAA